MQPHSKKYEDVHNVDILLKAPEEVHQGGVLLSREGHPGGLRRRNARLSRVGEGEEPPNTIWKPRLELQGPTMMQLFSPGPRVPSGLRGPLPRQHPLRPQGGRQLPILGRRRRSGLQLPVVPITLVERLRESPSA